MKSILHVLFTIGIFPLSLFSQEQSGIDNPWGILFDFAFQSHDARRSDLSDTRKIDHSENALGNYQIGLNINKPIINTIIFSVSAGMGWARETNTLTRPYDHCYNVENGGFCTFVLRHCHRYHIDQVQFPINFNLKIWRNKSNHWFLYSSVIPYFVFEVL